MTGNVTQVIHCDGVSTGDSTQKECLLEQLVCYSSMSSIWQWTVKSGIWALL